MLEAVSWYAIYFVMHLLDCYVFSKMTDLKFKINFKIIIMVLFFSIIDLTIGTNNEGLLKIFTSNFITFILLKIIYDKSISKTLISTIFIYFGYVISEILFALFFISLLNLKTNFIFETAVGIVFSNLIIFINFLILININAIKKTTYKIIIWYDEKKFFKIVSLAFISLLSCYIFASEISYNNYKNIKELILSISFFVIAIILIIDYFKEKSNNNQLTIKYDNLLDYVKDYELEVVEKGKAIHEHKNQLAVIDDMIPKSNKKLKEYVSEKLDKVSKLDDNVWLEKLTNLPTGGTKGLVYLKIKKMLDNNISIYVEIDDELKAKNKWNNVSKNLEDYTRILGVYLDNAIEASSESKDKQIIIEFIDNKDSIEFILSNTYNGIINFNEIDKEKYSTKGKGRGYGLSLVKDIVEKNKLISQSREINGKFYVQKLCIKK